MQFKYFISVSILVLLCSSCYRRHRIVTDFEIVNSPYIRAKTTNQDVRAIFDSLDKQLKINPEKVLSIYNMATQVKDLSNKLTIHIDSLKTLLISKTDGKPLNVADTISLVNVDSKENFDIPTRIMVNTAAAENGSKGEAHILKIMIGEYRKKILAVLSNPKDSLKMKVGLLTPNFYNTGLQERQTWEQFNFEEQPLASTIVTLTRIQNDIRNAEVGVLRELLHSVEAKK